MEDLTGLRPWGGPYGNCQSSQFGNVPSPRRLVNDYCALHTVHRCAAISHCPAAPFLDLYQRIGASAAAKLGLPLTPSAARVSRTAAANRPVFFGTARLGGWRELFVDALVN